MSGLPDINFPKASTSTIGAGVTVGSGGAVNTSSSMYSKKITQASSNNGSVSQVVTTSNITVETLDASGFTAAENIDAILDGSRDIQDVLNDATRNTTGEIEF